MKLQYLLIAACCVSNVLDKEAQCMEIEEYSVDADFETTPDVRGLGWLLHAQADDMGENVRASKKELPQYAQDIRRYQHMSARYSHNDSVSIPLRIYGATGPSHYVNGPTGDSGLSVTPVYARGPTGAEGPAYLLCPDVLEQELKVPKDLILSLEDLEDKADNNVILNYKHSRISDFQLPLTRNYSEVVLTLIKKAKSLDKSPKSLFVILAENYLQDEGVTAICKTILDNKPLQNNLVRFDLSNNRFTDKSLLSLRSIVVACPNLEIMDISINYVNYATFNEIFGSLPDPQRKKVIFSV